MGIYRASRLRTEAKAAAKFVALAMALSGIVATFQPWRAAARQSDPPQQQAVRSLTPIHRQLVSTAFFDDQPTQPAPSPASPDVTDQESHTDETVQRAHAPHWSRNPSDSHSQDLEEAAPDAPALGQVNRLADPPRLVLDPVPFAEPIVRGATFSGADRGLPASAQATSEPETEETEEAALAELELAAAALASQSVRSWDRWETVSMRRGQMQRARRRRVPPANSPSQQILRRVTPQERLRAFEWLFGPKEPQPPPRLTPVAAAAVAHDPACAAFYRFHQRGPRTVAVVGNGPLCETDAELINGMDVVMRLNRLNNW